MTSLSTEKVLQQIDAFSTPGLLLRASREAQGMSQREAADALNLVPQYVGIIERDEYGSLRSPAFARGYVKAYGRLLGISESQLLPLFDELIAREPPGEVKRIETRPLQLQATGLGVVIGLTALVVLLVLLWWWQGREGVAQRTAAEQPAAVSLAVDTQVAQVPVGEGQ